MMNTLHFRRRPSQGITLLTITTLLTCVSAQAQDSVFVTADVYAANFAIGQLEGSYMNLPHDETFPQAVELQILDMQRARALPTQQMSDNNSNIDLRENLVDGTNHGVNTVQQGAFQGVHGIATVIQNTGHNVAIQESMNINIAINPAR